MTDRVYPSAQKLNPPPSAAVHGGAKTTQLYNPNRPRPIYRPPPNRACSGRRCCCLCFLYTLITLLIVILLAVVGACVFYALYRPKHPTFSVTSLRTTRFNLTRPDSSGFAHLNSRVDLTLTAKNPNKHQITFLYDTLTVTLAAAGVPSGNATAAGFSHAPGNTTVLLAVVSSDAARELDPDSVSQLGSDLKKKVGFPVTVVVDTTVEVRLGKKKTKKVGVRVRCDGIKGYQPKNATSKVGVIGVTSNGKCKVDVRIKIWKFTF
ncbi:hypothetical protein RND81_03G142700 [Saponaria officinalis]|uniref:Late embryogenesis abundant protein LEA-2 subgroup domain-containing protein n=1 Tax=Saponaria officinalis TaxID=3572 RepID=A0AAW1M7V9_SAPOF